MIVIRHRTCRDIILLRLQEADLEGMELAEAYLAQAEMAGQHCRGASFQKANLTAADLSRADLRETDFRQAKLRRSNLRHADLRGATLVEADLCGADLYRADLRGADLSHAVLFDANLTGICYDDATCWPEGGAFIPHPSPYVSTWLLWRDNWQSTQAQVPRLWRNAQAHLPTRALAATALAAAALIAVIGSQRAPDQAQVVTARPAPSRPIVALRPIPKQPTVALRPKPALRPRSAGPVAKQPLDRPSRLAAAPRPRRRVVTIARAQPLRQVRPSVRRTTSVRGSNVRLARIPRRSRRVRPTSDQRLAQARPVQSSSPEQGRVQPVRLVVEAAVPVEQPRVTGSPGRAGSSWERAGTVRLVASPGATSPRARQALYTGPARSQGRSTRAANERPASARAAAERLPSERVASEAASTTTAQPAPRPRRESRRERGDRYAWGNPGFHYGSGYDIYRMNIGVNRDGDR